MRFNCSSDSNVIMISFFLSHVCNWNSFFFFSHYLLIAKKEEEEKKRIILMVRVRVSVGLFNEFNTFMLHPLLHKKRKEEKRATMNHTRRVEPSLFLSQSYFWSWIIWWWFDGLYIKDGLMYITSKMGFLIWFFRFETLPGQNGPISF